MDFNKKETYLAAIICTEAEKEKLTLKEVLNAVRLVISFFIHKAKL